METLIKSYTHNDHQASIVRDSSLDVYILRATDGATTDVYQDRDYFKIEAIYDAFVKGVPRESA